MTVMNKSIEVKLSNMKYAAQLSHKNNTISLFDTGATISCMSKACFDKLQPEPTLVQTKTYKVNGTNGNSLGPIERAHVLLNSPRNFSNNSSFANTYFQVHS